RALLISIVGSLTIMPIRRIRLLSGSIYRRTSFILIRCYYRGRPVNFGRIAGLLRAEALSLRLRQAAGAVLRQVVRAEVYRKVRHQAEALRRHHPQAVIIDTK